MACICIIPVQHLIPACLIVQLVVSNTVSIMQI